MGEVLCAPLLEAKLVAVRPVGDVVSGDGIEQFVVQAQAARCVPFALQRDQPALPVFACESFQSRKAASLNTRRCLNSDRRYLMPVNPDAKEVGAMAATHPHEPIAPVPAMYGAKPTQSSAGTSTIAAYAGFGRLFESKINGC